jgi:acetyltransferase EpsM
MKPKIVIIGAGGHGKVVCEAILSSGQFNIAGFVDSKKEVGSTVFNNLKVIVSQENLKNSKDFADYFIVAIGNNKIREKIYNEALKYLIPATIIHPSAIVEKSAMLKKGVICLANAVVSSSSIIGENTIINANVVVDHECVIGDHVHLSIGTLVGSNSQIANGFVSSIGAKIDAFSKIF